MEAVLPFGNTMGTGAHAGLLMEQVKSSKLLVFPEERSDIRDPYISEKN